MTAAARVLSVDELSELEEAIGFACRERLRAGWQILPKVTFSRKDRACCPIGAFVGYIPLMGIGPVTLAHLQWFATGFDGTGHVTLGLVADPIARAMFEMGRRFRERLGHGEL